MSTSIRKSGKLTLFSWVSMFRLLDWGWLNMYCAIFNKQKPYFSKLWVGQSWAINKTIAIEFTWVYWHSTDAFVLKEKYPKSFLFVDFFSFSFYGLMKESLGPWVIYDYPRAQVFHVHLLNCLTSGPNKKYRINAFNKKYSYTICRETGYMNN